MKPLTPDDTKDCERIGRAVDRLVRRNGALGIGYAIGAFAGMIATRSGIPIEQALEILEKAALAAKEARPHAP